MTGDRLRKVFLGDSPVRTPGAARGGQAVQRDGEPFYRITDYHAMPPFLMSVVSGYDHWLFVSSTGGLTCGRRAPETALFPYLTDDKIHDAWATTGPQTVVRISRGDRVLLWEPFTPGPHVYDVERNLYKNVPGNKLVFEEVNRDLDLVFSYEWTTGQKFGFVRKSKLSNTGTTATHLELLDGLRNLLPAGVERSAQNELSTLVDAYKQGETVEGLCAGVFSMSSILTDRAEPSEALKSTVVWGAELDGADVLLSEDQVASFRVGEDVRAERRSRGKRCAFYVRADWTLESRASRTWYLVADVERGPAQTADLLHSIRERVDVAAIERDVAEGTARIERLAGAADAFQKSSDALDSGRHFSNTLCNIMRGGVFPHAYDFSRSDFLDFVATRNRPLREVVEAALDGLDGPLTLDAARELAAKHGDPALVRLVYEYLPLAFSRRHGDPSRPWNHFSIDLTTATVPNG